MDNKKALQIIAENRESYNTIAPDFDAMRQNAWLEFEYLKQEIEKSEIRKLENQKIKLLDIGCGNGRLYKYLNDELRMTNYEYIGIDNSDNLINIARKNYPNADFRVADVFNLPFKESEFYVVAGIAFLHHIPSEELRIKVLKEIYRVLKSGGILFLSNWNLWRRETISHNVKRNKMNPLQFFFPYNGMDAGDFWIPFRAGNDGKPIPRYYHHFKKRELTALAKKSGFKIIFYKKDKNIITILQK